MSIKSELKKEGIEIIETIEPATISSIASNIVEVIQNAFPEKSINTHKLYSDIVKLHMYIANLPADSSAKYYYKNRSIYFSPNTSFTEITDLILHECIHYLQEKRNSKGKLLKLGFCDFTKSNYPGIGLNEAAVQLLASKCVNKKSEQVTYFELTFNTISPDYYPLECTLVNQLSYILGNNVLFDSTLNSTDDFKNQFISLTSREAYNTIQKNIDLLMEKEETIARLTAWNINNSHKMKKVQNNYTKIEQLKKDIKELFLKTQEFIIESYFDNSINLVYTSEQFDKYRTKLYNFRNVLATTDGYTFFNRYYIKKMMDLENRKENLLSPITTSMILYKENFFKVALSKFKYLLKITPKQDYYSYYQQEFYD